MPWVLSALGYGGAGATAAGAGTAAGSLAGGSAIASAVPAALSSAGISAPAAISSLAPTAGGLGTLASSLGMSNIPPQLQQALLSGYNQLANVGSDLFGSMGPKMSNLGGMVQQGAKNIIQHQIPTSPKDMILQEVGKTLGSTPPPSTPMGTNKQKANFGFNDQGYLWVKNPYGIY